MTAPEFVTVEQAADHLSMSRSLVLRMVRDGRLTGYINMSEIDARLRPIRMPIHRLPSGR
jgi:hypothetical protein